MYIALVRRITHRAGTKIKMDKKQITTEQLKPGIVILDEKTKTPKTIETVEYEINFNGNWIVSIWFTDQTLSKWSLGIHQAFFTQIN
tara:strand:- start:256 stop:516 length:261 start_codon:yes stop_codon:yes gene_type:complete